MSNPDATIVRLIPPATSRRDPAEEGFVSRSPVRERELHKSASGVLARGSRLFRQIIARDVPLFGRLDTRGLPRSFAGRQD